MMELILRNLHALEIALSELSEEFSAHEHAVAVGIVRWLLNQPNLSHEEQILLAAVDEALRRIGGRRQSTDPALADALREAVELLRRDILDRPTVDAWIARHAECADQLLYNGAGDMEDIEDE